MGWHSGWFVTKTNGKYIFHTTFEKYNLKLVQQANCLYSAIQTEYKKVGLKANAKSPYYWMEAYRDKNHFDPQVIPEVQDYIMVLTKYNPNMVKQWLDTFAKNIINNITNNSK